MSNILAKKFNFLSLLKFTAPTIIMMVFMSFYTMIDGVFVSKYIGTSALSAVNIVYPFLSFVIAVAIMLATGGSAVIAKKMGENKLKEAKENFSLIILIGIIIGIIITILGLIFLDPLIRLLGASDAIYQFCYDYGLILILFTTFGILQMLFQYFFVTAGKPTIGLIVTFIGGVANIVLDYVFIVPMDMGIAGAALATGIGFSIPAIFGFFYFLLNKKGVLHLTKPKLDFKMLFSTFVNGSSEMVINLAGAVTTFLFNIVMMQYLGEDGVAAITIILYAQFLLIAIYLGYSSGIAPIISYNYGNKNTQELRKLFKISMIFLIVTSLINYIVSILLANNIVTIFAEQGTSVFNIAKDGFRTFSISYIFIGINIFASGMFTALSNGKVSAIISFLRTFLFLIISIIFLPKILGIEGIWLAVPIAEFLTIIISIIYLIKLRKTYEYA